MKTLALPVLTLALLMLTACAESNAPTTDTELTPANFKVQANVTGMTCTGCSGSIEAAVNKIDGVTACAADPATGDVRVGLADDVDKAKAKKDIEATIAGLSDGKYTINQINLVEAAEVSSEKADDIELTEEPNTAEPAE